MSNHVQKAHKLTPTPGVRQGFKCRLCGVIFLTKEPLINHIKTIHSDVMRSQGLNQSASVNEPLGKLNSIFPDFTNITPVTASSVGLKVETKTDFGIRPSDDGPHENGSEIRDPLSIDNDIKTAVNDLLSINKEAISAVEDLLGIDKEVASAVEDLLSIDPKPIPAVPETSSSDKKPASCQEEAEEEEEGLVDALPGNVRLLPEEQLQGNRIVVNSNSFRPMKTQASVKSQWAQVQGGKAFTQPQTFGRQAERKTSNQISDLPRQGTAATQDQNLVPGQQEAAKASSHQTWWSEPSTGEKQV